MPARPARTPGEQADHERAGAANGVRVDEGPERPAAQQHRLVRRHLQALRSLEDHGAERQGRHHPHRADHRRPDVAAGGCDGGEGLPAAEERQPDHDHGEATQRRQLVEVGRDQPDQADADEGPTEAQQQARQGGQRRPGW